MARELNAGHQTDIKTANHSSENAVKSKYLGTNKMSETFFHEDFKSTLNSGNACYRSGQTPPVILTQNKLNVQNYRSASVLYSYRLLLILRAQDRVLTAILDLRGRKKQCWRVVGGGRVTNSSRVCQLTFETKKRVRWTWHVPYVRRDWECILACAEM